MTGRRLAAALVVAAAAGGCRGGTEGPAAGPAPGPATTAVTAPATTSTLPPPPAWQERAAAPTARQEVAATAAGGKVWVLGGLTAAGASATVEAYDPAADRWSAGPDLPVAVHHAAATTYRGEVVVAGGFLSATDLYSRPSDRVFALRAGAWVELPRLARPRGAAAAVAVGDRLVLAGGRDASRLVAPTEIYDGAAWHDAAPIPAPRDHLAMASDGRVAFAVGGRRLGPDALSAQLDRYDPATDAWATLAAMPTARGGLGAAVAGGRLVAAGGEDSSRTFAQVEAYDVAAGAWSALPDLPSPRHGLALATVGPVVVALVGGVQAGVAPSARAEALSPL